MTTDGLQVVADWILFAAALGGVAFAVSYAFFFRWTKTEAGRALLSFVVSLDLVFGLNITGRIFGIEHDWWPWLRIAVYVTVLCSIWWLLFVLWRSWRAGYTLKLEPKDAGNTPRV